MTETPSITVVSAGSSTQPAVSAVGAEPILPGEKAAFAGVMLRVQQEGEISALPVPDAKFLAILPPKTPIEREQPDDDTGDQPELAQAGTGLPPAEFLQQLQASLGQDTSLVMPAVLALPVTSPVTTSPDSDGEGLAASGADCAAPPTLPRDEKRPLDRGDAEPGRADKPERRAATASPAPADVSSGPPAPTPAPDPGATRPREVAVDPRHGAGTRAEPPRIARTQTEANKFKVDAAPMPGRRPDKGAEPASAGQEGDVSTQVQTAPPRLTESPRLAQGDTTSPGAGQGEVRQLKASPAEGVPIRPEAAVSIGIERTPRQAPASPGPGPVMAPPQGESRTDPGEAPAMAPLSSAPSPGEDTPLAGRQQALASMPEQVAQVTAGVGEPAKESEPRPPMNGGEQPTKETQNRETPFDPVQGEGGRPERNAAPVHQDVSERGAIDHHAIQPGQPLPGDDRPLAGAVRREVTGLPSLRLAEPQAPAELQQRVNLMLSERLQQAEIQLDPLGLGKMKIQLKLGAVGEASVQFLVQHGQTRELLEQAMPRLREMLAGQGILLGQTVVQQQAQPPLPQSPQWQPHSQQPPQQQPGQQGQERSPFADQGWQGGADMQDSESMTAILTLPQTLTDGDGIDFYA